MADVIEFTTEAHPAERGKGGHVLRCENGATRCDRDGCEMNRPTLQARKNANRVAAAMRVLHGEPDNG